MATIRVIGDDKVSRGLDGLGDLRKWGDKPMRRSLDKLEEEARDYPTKDPSAFTTLATPGQKRAYWAKVNSGEISHGTGGYIRSQKLRDSWRKRVKLNARQALGTLYTDLSHAQYVMGNRRQPFHKQSGWQTDKELAEDTEREITFYWDDGAKVYIRANL